SRRRHDRTRDRQHLLLSARQQACVLRSTLAQDREIAVDGLEVARDAIAILARIGAHHQVVVDRQQRKDLAPLGYVAQPALHDVCGVARGDVLAVELDRSLERVDDARNRLQDRRLAGAVGPEDGRDLAFAHLQADPADGLDRTIGALDVEQLQDGLAHGAALRSDVASSAVPRYASVTPGWPCTSGGVPSASISPWFIASTRSDTFETSDMSCSTISTVMPRSSRMSWIQKAMSPVSSTFNPEEGSSSSSSFGSVASARASSTTLRTPYGRPATIVSR